MCGFVGIFGKNIDSYYDKVVKASEIIKYRGPDDFGIFKDENLIIAHRRLKIIDLSKNAHQPMSIDDNIIAYNGEVYNYLELKNNLNVDFKSTSDTEVILRYLMNNGTSILSKFNGMFAIAFYKRKNKELFLIRDRFGIKPLYYMVYKGNIIFASEIKAILSIIDTVPPPDDISIFHYIASGYGYIDTDEYTFFSGIKKVKQSHFMRIKINSGLDMYERKWWDISKPSKIINKLDEATDLVREILLSSIKLRLRSDVPVALALSGGIDSSTIALLIKQFSLVDKIKTFSVSYHDYKDYDELKYIKAVLHKTGFDNILIHPGAEDLKNIIYKITWHGDEPYAGASVFAEYMLYKKIHENNIKVILTGQGSDEIFAGYDKFDNFFTAELLSRGKIKNNLTMSALKLLFSFFIRDFKLKILTNMRVNKVLLEAENFFVRPNVIDSLKKSYNKFRLLKGYNDKKFDNVLTEELYRSVFISPLPSLVHIDDRNSMAHSVETRPIFLDYRLVNLAFSIDNRLKIFNGMRKYVLRNVLKGYMPDILFNRKDKMGFVTPMHEWFKDNLRNDFIEKVQNSELIERYGDKKQILHFFNNNIDNKRVAFIIWVWYSLAIWENVFYNNGKKFI